MNRRVFLLGLPGMAGCYRPGLRRLNVLNWTDYVAPETIPDFEREFQVRLRYGTFESAEEMLSRVMSGNSGWDVVFPSNSFVEPMRGMGLLAKLDHSRLKNLHRLEKRFQRPPWDPEMEFVVPYMWGATGIIYQSLLPSAITSWADLWDARLAGKITMLDDPAEVIGACLKKLHLPLNSGDARELELSRNEAKAQKPLLRAYVNDTVRDQLVAGEVMASQAWRPTAVRAMHSAGDKLRFVYPKEGYAIYADNAAILRESQRKELAHSFIDYLCRPAVAARIAEVQFSSTVNEDAQALAPKNVLLYPDAETLSRGEWFAPLSLESQRIRDRIWTEIKAA
ncbi:MAG: spermidine/putrescine ABC transporter substrate-binding protein [Candidatus Solibacter usitatus]|nr:spermidine/putrescine ABC transporter substrate-binding protein [Candidatus Solibacter usitatus]